MIYFYFELAYLFFLALVLSLLVGIAYIFIVFLVLIAFNSNVYHNIRSVYLRTIRYLFNIPPPKITRQEALILAKNILTFCLPARDINLGIMNYTAFAASEGLHTWLLERRDTRHKTWVVIDNQDGTIIKRSWDWYLNQKNAATQSVLPEPKASASVPVQEILPSPKTPDSDPISEKNSEVEQTDTKQSIDKTIEK